MLTSLLCTYSYHHINRRTRGAGRNLQNQANRAGREARNQGESFGDSVKSFGRDAKHKVSAC